MSTMSLPDVIHRFKTLGDETPEFACSIRIVYDGTYQTFSYQGRVVTSTLVPQREAVFFYGRGESDLIIVAFSEHCGSPYRGVGPGGEDAALAVDLACLALPRQHRRLSGCGSSPLG